MKWHCGVCLYIYKWLGFSLKSNKCPVLLRAKASGKVPDGTIFARPYACKLTTAFVRNALPKVALLSLANQTSQRFLLVFLDDCHSLSLVSSATGSTRKRPPIQICSQIWRWVDECTGHQQSKTKKDTKFGDANFR